MAKVNNGANNEGMGQIMRKWGKYNGGMGQLMGNGASNERMGQLMGEWNN